MLWHKINRTGGEAESAARHQLTAANKRVGFCAGQERWPFTKYPKKPLKTNTLTILRCNWATWSPSSYIEHQMSRRPSVLLNWGEYETYQNYLLNKVTSISVLPYWTLRKSRSLRIPEEAPSQTPLETNACRRSCRRVVTSVFTTEAHTSKTQALTARPDTYRANDDKTPSADAPLGQPLRKAGVFLTSARRREAGAGWRRRSGPGSGAPPAGAARSEPGATGRRRRRRGTEKGANADKTAARLAVVRRQGEESAASWMKSAITDFLKAQTRRAP